MQYCTLTLLIARSSILTGSRLTFLNWSESAVKYYEAVYTVSLSTIAILLLLYVLMV